MTIDEAIKHEKWEAEFSHLDEEADESVIAIKKEYHEQLAEWLERLKFLQAGQDTIYREVYNKAIDDIYKKSIKEYDERFSSDEICSLTKSQLMKLKQNS